MPTQLRDIRKFTDLVRYLESELEWPVEAGSFDDLTFEYHPAELGLKDEDAVKIKKIHQLRPLVSGQPWGVFFVEFDKKKLPVVVLRRILSHLVIKKRTTANSAERAAWNPHDILFVSAFGDEAIEQREIAFAHFHQEEGDLPTLRVLGWDGGDTPLQLDHVAGELRVKLHWPADPRDHAAWRNQWSGAFRHRIGHIIRTADNLAEVLAALARGIRDRCTVLMRAESDTGPLTKLYKAFQAALIHDLEPADFADTYAQTITYGLLTAAINRTDMSGGTEATYVKADDLTLMVRVTSPFLKEMLQTFLKVGGRKDGVDFDELGIQDVVELLRGGETDLPAILRNFGDKKPGEDPVIHFYEHFLSAYNKKLKIQRGVFYTPQPVVSYIVRSVHELLQTEFGLEDGLASTVTWREMMERHKGLELPTVNDPNEARKTISPDEPFVQILDPATGTATFLVEVIDVIYRTLTAKWKKQGRLELEMPKLWNEYVPKHLLPRLHGYELLAAPYAIAHLKLGLKLTETGYRFGSDERARIYLTNALEPKVNQLPQIGFAPLAHEAKAVNEVKWYKRFTVVVGNPPYAGVSANMSDAASDLVTSYKFVDGQPLGERKHWLQDDYVKFIRLGQLLLESAGLGALGFITNHGYLDNPTFRGMRQNLMSSFSAIRVLDLHGSVKKRDSTTIAKRDENVFDIEQGVAIGLFVKSTNRSTGTKVWHDMLLGPRAEKYAWLSKHSLIGGGLLSPTSPYYFFIKREETHREEYETLIPVTSVFRIWSTGVQTSRDSFAVAESRQELERRLGEFLDPAVNDLALTTSYGLKDMSFWKVPEVRQAFRQVRQPFDYIKKIDYRPFDSQFVVFHELIIHRPKAKVMSHMLAGKNLALLLPRQLAGEHFHHAFCSRNLAEMCVISSKTTEQNNLFPLYIFDGSPTQDLLPGSVSKHSQAKHLNLDSTFLKTLSQTLNLETGDANLPKGITPEDIFHYAYAIFNSPRYRSRYAEFLKIDFPRLPLTETLELFRALGRLGGELVTLHLLESPKLDKPITEFIGGRKPEVEKLSWSENTVWLDKAQTTGFKGVREDVWNFHIGGYQVCEKWLKDRKGRTLTAADRTHYQKIVVALSETIRLMAEIDAVIEKHGGWPMK